MDAGKDQNLRSSIETNVKKGFDALAKLAENIKKQLDSIIGKGK